jgi:hypothetical protein
LCDQCVHSTELNTGPTALVAKVGGGNVVVPIGLYEGEGTEAFNDCRGGLWAGESLKEFLKYQTGRDNHV